MATLVRRHYGGVFVIALVRGQTMSNECSRMGMTRQGGKWWERERRERVVGGGGGHVCSWNASLTLLFRYAPHFPYSIYIDEMYQAWKQDPKSVHKVWRESLRGGGLPPPYPVLVPSCAACM